MPDFCFGWTTEGSSQGRLVFLLWMTGGPLELTADQPSSPVPRGSGYRSGVLWFATCWEGVGGDGSRKGGGAGFVVHIGIARTFTEGAVILAEGHERPYCAEAGAIS
jgi:hypothetical protein